MVDTLLGYGWFCNAGSWLAQCWVMVGIMFVGECCVTVGAMLVYGWRKAGAGVYLAHGWLIFIAMLAYVWCNVDLRLTRCWIVVGTTLI